MTSARGGRRSKSDGLTQNLNKAVDKVTLKALEMDEKRLAKDREKLLGKEEEDSPEEEDGSFAYQMLRDLRAAYKSGKGKSKLLTLMKDDKEFKFLIKELLKVETAMMAAKIRRDPGQGGGGDRPAVYVVLKGLECEKPLLTAIAKNEAFDIEQVMAATNPEFSSDRYVAPANASQDRPDEIVKILAGVEQ
jgi:hypothetical protein